MGFLEQQHVARRGQPGQIAQAVRQGVPVAPGGVREVQHRGDAQQQGRLAVAAGQVDAPGQQAGIAANGGQRAQIVLGDEEHARACGVGQAGVEAGIAHGVVSWLISNRRKLS